jgi:hypothetical protein
MHPKTLQYSDFFSKLLEQVFAKLKHFLRKTAARTIDTVCAAIGRLLGTYTAEECANYLRNAGYA